MADRQLFRADRQCHLLPGDKAGDGAGGDGGAKRRNLDLGLIAGKCGDPRLERGDRPDETGDKAAGGVFIHFDGAADLFHLAPVHHRDAVRQGHRLFLIVGHNDECDAGAFLNRHQFKLRRLAQLLIQCGQGLIQQQQFGLPRQSPRKCHPLPLPAGNLVRFARGIGGQLHQFQHFAHPCCALVTAHRLVFQPIPHVLFHRHVRKQRIALKHHVNRAGIGGHSRHILPVNEDAPRRRVFKPRQHPQQGGLATARAAQQPENLALFDGQRYVAHRLKAAETFRHSLNADKRGWSFGHGYAAPVIVGPPAFRR